MNRLSRVGIAVALLAGVLWSGGGAQAVRLPSAVTVCVDAPSGVVSRVMSGDKCVGAAQFWSATKSAPLLCWNASSVKRLDRSRLVSVAPSSGCVTPLRSVRAGKVALLCADAKTGVLHWPVTGLCESGNEQTWVRSASAPNVAPTSTTATTTAVVMPSVSLSATSIEGGTFPKAVTVTANVAGTIYFAEGAFVVKTVTDITSAPSHRWAKGTVTSANTPTSIAIDVDAVANGYYRVFVANSQGVLSAPATNIVTVSVTRASTATTTAVALTCAQGGSCTVGVDTGPGGGIVFYYSATAFTSTGSTCNTNCHYLEVAPSDQSTGIVWATAVDKCNNSSSNNNNCQLFSIYDPYATPNQADSRTASTAIGKGMANTNTIYDPLTRRGVVSTSSYAAGIAWAYTNNSKTDWFLPSKDELNELCKYAKNTGQASGGGTVCAGAISASVRGFSTVNYWSSSESTDGSTAWVQTFNAGTQNNYPKDNLSTYYVRPIRAF
jgi:hypothetical protein